MLVTERDNIDSLAMTHFKSSKEETLKFYKCFKKEQYWLINFSVKKNNNNLPKIGLNNEIIFLGDKNFDETNKFYFSYVTPKIKEFNFIVKTGPKAELYNGTFTPINVN